MAKSTIIKADDVRIDAIRARVHITAEMMKERDAHMLKLLSGQAE